MLKSGDSDPNTMETNLFASGLQPLPDGSLAAWRDGEGSCTG